MRILPDWRSYASCRGADVEHLKIRTCWKCPVRWQCLWVALESDDRIDPYGGAMWVRGGIVAGTRDRQWYLSRGNIDEAFDRCKEISLKVEDAKGKRKAKEGK